MSAKRDFNQSAIPLKVLMMRRRALISLIAGISVPGIWARTASADTVNYTYDAQGRLVSATYSSGYSVTYTYDSAGNRTQKVVSTGGGGASPPGLLSASPSAPSWNEDNDNGADDPIDVSVSGGTAPYSYAWTFVSGNTHIQATNPSGSSTSFGYNTFPFPHGGTFTAVWKCTVTDSASGSVSFNVTASINFNPE